MKIDDIVQLPSVLQSFWSRDIFRGISGALRSVIVTGFSMWLLYLVTFYYFCREKKRKEKKYKFLKYL